MMLSLRGPVSRSGSAVLEKESPRTDPGPCVLFCLRTGKSFRKTAGPSHHVAS
jgi:hypothetical protein